MQKNVLTRTPCYGIQQGARNFVALALFLFCSASVTPKSNTVSTVRSNVWVFHKTVDNVDFYHMLTNCNGKSVVLLKFNNKNDYKVKVSWKEVFTTQLEKSVEGFNGIKQLFIGTGETMCSGCKDDKIKELLILPEQVTPSYGVSILGFAFKDVTVSLIQ